MGLLQIWANYEEPKEEIQENEDLERKISYKTVVITEVTKDMHFYAQNTETGKSSGITRQTLIHLCRNAHNDPSSTMRRIRCSICHDAHVSSIVNIDFCCFATRMI